MLKIITLVLGAVIILGFLIIFLMLWYSEMVLNSKVEPSSVNAATSVGAKPPITLPQEVPPPTKDRLGAIDRILEELKFGNVAFNAPKKMNLGDTTVIHLMLGLETTLDDLKQTIEAAGEKEGARIRVSDRMEARLSGTNFLITAITPEIQAISRNDLTEWKWEVKPGSEGRHYLHLTLSALLSVDGASTARAIRTFDKVIEVKVVWNQRVGSFFEKNWQWLWAAILVPIVGWLWKRKKAPKPDVNQSHS